MKRVGLSFLMAVFIGSSLMIVDVGPAEAVTCSSVCSQIRRACLNLSKAVRKVSRADCDETRDACRSDCAANSALTASGVAIVLAEVGIVSTPLPGRGRASSVAAAIC